MKSCLEEQVLAGINQLKQDISQWTIDSIGSVDNKVDKYIMASMDKFIRNMFAYFYAMPKIHKEGPMGSNTSGVSSDCGSLPHTLEQWVDKLCSPWLRVKLCTSPTQWH